MERRGRTTTGGAQAPWTVLAQGSPLSYKQMDLIDKFEYAMRSGADLKSRLTSENMEELMGGLLTALMSLPSADGINRAATMILQIITYDRKYPDYVLKALGPNAFQPFIVHLKDGSSTEISGKVATAMGILLCNHEIESLEPKDLINTQIDQYLKWICDTLGNDVTEPAELVSALTALGHFLRTDTNRLKFIQYKRGPVVVGNLLEKENFAKVQVEYQAVFIFWLLSFTASPEQCTKVEQVMNDVEVARRMTAILREIPAEKVVRITLALLRNLAAEKYGSRLRREMVGAGLVGALEQLCLKRWSDGDIRDDLFALTEVLQKELTSMSTFDVYRSEVLSGALSWTPVHKDETFWRENTEKMEQHNMELLRCLVRSLHESTDPVVLSVACHDLSMFIKHHPRGRLIAQTLGVKARLMELMTDPDPDIRRQALTCVQILMISHYQLIPDTKK